MQLDPIARFQQWFAQASRRVPLAEAVALATCTKAGHPSVRYVLLKQADEAGFVFFTDGRSRKGSELQSNPRAAMAFYWHELGRQVRVEGKVIRVSSAEADAYWSTRPRPSRIAAASSLQSATLAGRELLLARWVRLQRQYRGQPVPRPPAWTGFRIVPDSIEFWTRGAHRLHRRELFRRRRTGWERRLLQP